jgi:hypothetical protein
MNAWRRIDLNRIDRKTERLVHVSTPFGRITVGLSERSELRLQHGKPNLPTVEGRSLQGPTCGSIGVYRR